MTYELAKELKDAGFPQEGVRPKEPAGWGGGQSDVINPTLSELIAACGEDFGSLHKYGEVWDAEPATPLLERIGSWSGSTPEEAVARLWLALKV